MRQSYAILAAALLVLATDFAVASEPVKSIKNSELTTSEESSESAIAKKKRRRKGGKGRGRGRGGNNGAFSQGKSMLSVGIGGPNLVKKLFELSATDGFSEEADAKVTGVGPYHVKYEYGVSKHIGIGLSAGFVTVGYDRAFQGYDYVNNVSVPAKETFSLTNFVFVPRINFHMGSNKYVDPYFGLGAGYQLYNLKYTNTDPSGLSTFAFPASGLAMEVVFGTRIMFSQNLGIYIETGYAKSLMQGGLTLKF